MEETTRKQSISGPVAVAADIDICEREEMGWGKYRPLFIQRFASIKYFIAFTSVLTMFTSALSSGYSGSVITTIEKRFDISSTKASLLTAAYETGAVGFLSIVSFLGAKRHIPNWICSGALMMACGALIMVTPHLFVDPYHVQQPDNVTMENVCNPDKEGNNTTVLKDQIEKELCSAIFNSNFFAILILCSAQMMMGIGSTPILTLTPVYIDNHVSKSQASSHISFIYAFGSLGPVIGFAVGAIVLQIHVDFLSLDTKQLNFNSTDPQWVGAWWGGYLIFAGLLVIFTLPVFSFPKTLKRDHQAKLNSIMDEKIENSKFVQEEQEEPLNSKAIMECENNANDQSESNLKDLPNAILKLLKNPLFMIATIAIITEVFIIVGFIQFTPKYMENQFLISKSKANLLTGLIPIPGCMVGILIGGYILRRFDLGAKGAIQLTLAINVVVIMGFLVLFGLGCENTNTAGATTHYFRNTSWPRNEFMPNLSESCNDYCRCSENDISLVCGVNGLTYFSPCHAGCSNSIDCKCILEDLLSFNDTVVANQSLYTKGPCKQNCSSFPVYGMLLMALTVMVGITQMPLFMIVFRNVDSSERSLALGVQLIFVRLLSNVPSPLVFAKLIDKSCLLWKKTCGSNGMCLFYDSTHFRMNYIGLGGIVKGFGFIIYCCVWALIIWQEKKQKLSTEKKYVVNPDTCSAVEGGDNAKKLTASYDQEQNQVNL